MIREQGQTQTRWGVLQAGTTCDTEAAAARAKRQKVQHYPRTSGHDLWPLSWQKMKRLEWARQTVSGLLSCAWRIGYNPADLGRCGSFLLHSTANEGKRSQPLTLFAAVVAAVRRVPAAGRSRRSPGTCGRCVVVISVPGRLSDREKETKSEFNVPILCALLSLRCLKGE